MSVWLNQAAVIPVLDGRVCMVTSSRRKRWVFPKGQIEPGQTPGATALLEAWEEAGLVGSLDPEPVGNYVYEKYDLPHHVLVYRLRVIEARDDWPERGLRERAWLSPEEALTRIEEPALRELVRRLFPAADDALGLALA